MQVTVENSGALQRRLTVQVPGDEVRQKIDARLREIGKTARLPGFRPGRIPMSVLKQRYGKSVMNEVVSQTLQTSLGQALQQESISPAANPVIERVEDVKADTDFEFTALVEVFPEFEKIDAGKISISNPDTEVTEDDVDDMLQTLREQRGSWDDVERKPEEGDQVLIEYSAETEDGRVPEEGTARLAIAMGQSGLAKLEKALSGLEAGGEKKVKLDLPENFGVPELAGKKATLDLKVDSVREQNLPEIDEEFIKSFSIDSGDVDEMRAEVRNNLDRELKAARTTFLKTQLFNGLLEAFPEVEVPDGMVRDEAGALLQEAARQRGQEPDPSQMPAFEDMARRRVKGGLLIGEIARQNDILVDGARVREAIETVANTYEQSREVVQMYYNNEEMLKQVENSVLEEQVVDWVLENADVKSEAVKFKDLISAAAMARQGL